MSETLSKESKARSGRVRVDDRPKHLATRLERGEIAVINVADLDRDSAAALVEAAPTAVLNAQPSLTGRVAALGPRLILDAGITLVDDLGQDIMSLREGQDVTVTGGKVLVDGGVIATGRAVSADDLGLETEAEKEEIKKAEEDNKALFDFMTEKLGGKVKAVKLSQRLKTHPVCVTSEGALSVEMEKVLSKQPGSEGVKSDKVLELNINHPVFAVLKAAQEAGDTDKVKKYSSLLYAQAQLIEGLPVDDPAAYAEAVCSLMK